MEEPIRRNHQNKYAGIYQISNYTNDKIYIGSSVNISKRIFDQHLNSLQKGSHYNRHLQNHVNKYGIDDLLFDEIERVYRHYRTESLDKFKIRLLEREQFYINILKPTFNVCKIIHPYVERNLKGINSKPIDQYTLQGKYVNTYKSMTEAEIQTGICRASISACIKNYKTKSAGNFLWVYKNDLINKNLKKYEESKENEVYKTICQYDLQGNYLNTYPSIQEASRQTKINHSTIHHQLYDKCISTNKFIWCLQNEDITKKVERYNIFQKQIINSKIFQWDLNGNFIAEYKNQKDAERKNNMFGSGISNYLSGKYRKAGNFIWTHGEKPTQEQIEKANDKTYHIDPIIKSRSIYKGIYTRRKQKEAENKLIDQYDLQGNFIKTYKSRCEITIQTGIDASYILKCIQGRCVSAKGFFFVNHKESINEKLEKQYKKLNPSTQKQVYQFSLKGEYINKYKSINDAVRLTNINHTNISSCLSGKQTYTGKYIFTNGEFPTIQQIEKVNTNKILYFNSKKSL